MPLDVTTDLPTTAEECLQMLSFYESLVECVGAPREDSPIVLACRHIYYRYLFYSKTYTDETDQFCLLYEQQFPDLKLRVEEFDPWIGLTFINCQLALNIMDELAQEKLADVCHIEEMNTEPLFHPRLKQARVSIQPPLVKVVTNSPPLTYAHQLKVEVIDVHSSDIGKQIIIGSIIEHKQIELYQSDLYDRIGNGDVYHHNDTILELGEVSAILRRSIRVLRYCMALDRKWFNIIKNFQIRIKGKTIIVSFGFQEKRLQTLSELASRNVIMVNTWMYRSVRQCCGPGSRNGMRLIARGGR